MRNLTPVNFADPYTIMGTYDMLTFEQNHELGWDVGAKICKKKDIIIKDCVGNSLERMVGEITASVDTVAKTVKMYSKIQMNSLVLRGSQYGINLNEQTFRFTDYQLASYDLTSIAMNGFGEGNAQDKGTVTANNEVWEGQKSDIYIYSAFKQEVLHGKVDVTVKVFGKKKDDQVITLSKDVAYYCLGCQYLPVGVACPYPDLGLSVGKVTQLWQ